MTAVATAVFDCNVFLQALANPSGPAGRCVELAIAKEVSLFVSPVILDELLEVTAYPKVITKFKLRAERVSAFMTELPRFTVLTTAVPSIWTYSRDPDDAHYVNLALAVGARFLVSRDKDLLDLTDPMRLESRDFQNRFPALTIIDPVAFIRQFRAQDPERTRV